MFLAVEQYAKITAQYETPTRYTMLPTTFFETGRWYEYVSKTIGNNVSSSGFPSWVCETCGKENSHTGSFCLACGQDKANDQEDRLNEDGYVEED